MYPVIIVHCPYKVPLYVIVQYITCTLPILTIYFFVKHSVFFFLGYCSITEFEFTRECAIFDLLDIPLYHGWIVDPQV